MLLPFLFSCSQIPQKSPSIPAENDSSYRINGLQAWYLIGNDLDRGEDEIRLEIEGPTSEDIHVWLDPLEPQRLLRTDDGFSLELDISSLPVGSYDLILAAANTDVAFAHFRIHRSHPLYVIVSTDWDDADNAELALRLQEELHEEYPELLLTHFVGPYTFTDPTVSAERREFLADWVLGMQNDYGDEIGLHIHPYCNFVESIPQTCLEEPSLVYENGDSSGYTIMVNAYSEEEFTEQLLVSDALFVENGLPKPTSFRAGGWSADITTIRALHNADYIADTSANNWARLEEWEGLYNGVLYDWNRENWSEINDTSQPYYPSQEDVQSDSGTRIPVLEVPDNGSLVDYVSGEEMIEILNANWPEHAPLQQPIAYSIGYHPSNFNMIYKINLQEIFDYIQPHLSKHGSGPIHYQTLSNMTKVWPFLEGE